MRRSWASPAPRTCSRWSGTRSWPTWRRCTPISANSNTTATTVDERVRGLKKLNIFWHTLRLLSVVRFFSLPDSYQHIFLVCVFVCLVLLFVLYLDRYEFVGQNLYIYQTTRSSAEIQWPYVIKEWYDEIQIAPPAVAQSFDLFNLNIGHFTQIAWATTNRIGCGYVTYDTSGSGDDESNSIFKTAQLYTCNYAPGGNFLGEKMYEDGNAASRCPARYRRSKRFTSLCEIARANNKNTNNGGQKPNKKANKNKNKKNPSGTSTRSTSRRVTTTTVQKISPVRTTTTTFYGENEITGIREQVTPLHSTPLITRFTTTTTTTNNNNNGGQPLQTESFNFNPSSTTTTTFSNPNNFNTLLTTPNLQLPTSTTLGVSTITTTTVNGGNGDNNPKVNFISDDTPSPSITTTNRREGAEGDDGSSLVLLRTTPLITTSINRFPTSTSTTTTTLQARPVSAPPPSPSTSTRTTFTTSTTRRNVARPTSRPPPPPQTSSSTFSLRPFSSRPTLTNNDGISVTATSKRVAPWWDKWSNNFANSISPRRPPPRFSTTRSPWRRWSSGWTTR